MKGQAATLPLSAGDQFWIDEMTEFLTSPIHRRSAAAFRAGLFLVGYSIRPRSVGTEPVAKLNKRRKR